MDLHGFGMIFVDLGRFWGVAGLEGLTTCGSLWQPVAACGSLWHGDPTPYKEVNKKIRSWKLPISGRIDLSMHRAWRPLGARRLVNDDKEEDWRDLPHARA